MGKKPTGKEPDLVYRMKVTLKHVRPPIWRKIRVRGETRIDLLHQILQIVMGWTDSHLHKFRIGGVSYGDTSMESAEGMKNEKRYSLSKLVSEGKARFSYIYDWGDYWEHEILVEEILLSEEGANYPVCLGGKRACPPEDCGGPGDYEDLLAILSNPSHPEHEQMFESLPGDFDSEKFDAESVNRTLKTLEKKPKRTWVRTVDS